MSARGKFWSKVHIVHDSDSCWEWTASRDDHGYGMFRVAPDKVRRAHRVAYEFEHGPVGDGTIFLHSCDNPPCVRPSHVRPGTHAENAADRDAKGRHWTATGEDHWAAILDEAAVAEIRSVPRYTRGVLPGLAKKYGVALQTIYCVRWGGSWEGVGR